MLEEHFFQCPFCWQQISMMLELTAGAQAYVEDCEICCNPISLSYEAEDGALVTFSADALEQ
jgi:transcription elongation factor Elf1